MKTTICLIRHGETNWNKDHLIQGRLNNPLNEEGIKQAHNVSNILKDHDSHFDIIISSPLDRAYLTAQIIKETLNIKRDIIIMDEVIERDFGDAEGQTIGKEIYDKILRNDVLGLELSHNLQERANKAIKYIEEKYRGKRIIVATHSHFIKGLFTTLDPKYTFTYVFKNTSLNYVEIEDGKITYYIDNKCY